MLPKPEKISKKKLSSESEELPKVVDPEIKIAALRKKRLMVSFGLGITVVLSLSFSIYRYIKNTKFVLPKINPPSISLGIKQNNNILTMINKELISDSKIWNLQIVDSNNDSPINYSNSSTNIDYNFEKINSELFESNQEIQQFLPGGVIVKYYSVANKSDLICHVLMQNPQQDIQISFAILNAKDLKESQILPQIGSLSQKIYWYLVSN